MKTFIFIIVIALSLTLTAIGQVKPVEKDRTATVNVPDAPPSFVAKYEGGMFGYSEKQTGTLKIDDVNQRLVFHGKDGKEKFALSYSSMQVISPQSKSVTSNTGNVISHIPLPGSFLGGLIKEKWRYLVISFSDQDVDRAYGTVSFKLSNKQLLESVVKSIGTNAKMTQRGNAYYRPKPVIKSKTEI